MAKEKKTKGKLPWHSAFYAGLQIELEEEAYKLTFENEHQLGTDPMRIDVLIIKKYTEEQIQKNIGRIFREYNIIEYNEGAAISKVGKIIKINNDGEKVVETLPARKYIIEYKNDGFKIIEQEKNFQVKNDTFIKILRSLK